MALLREARGYELRPARGTVGSGSNQVIQDMLLQDALDSNGLFSNLTSEFQSLFNEAVCDDDHFAGQVVFNDWIVQKYTPGCQGITPHRDRTDYRYIICLFVLSGHGRFYIATDRGKSGQQEIANLPGDVILMPGPGFKGLDKRPFHYLEDISEERFIFGLRHDETKLD